MPRSRSFWLSRFLSGTGWDVSHDAIRFMRNFEDLEAFGRTQLTGSCETAAAPWWRLLQAKCPGLRTVTVRRDRGEVLRSFQRLGMRMNWQVLGKTLEHLDRKMDQIERRVAGNLSVDFAEIGQESGCAKLFSHCLGQELASKYWHDANGVNLQCNLPGMFRYFAANAGAIERFRKIAIRWHLSQFAKSRVPSGDFTFQLEPLDVILSEGKDLVDEHLALVGEAPGTQKNYPLWRKLEGLGVIHFLTARSNGKLFGYLMWIVGPSLEVEGATVATQASFYTSPAAAGLGRRMEKEFLSRVREAGVDEVVFRAGNRGSGPRLGALFTRLGAAVDGTSYLLNLKES